MIFFYSFTFSVLILSISTGSLVDAGGNLSMGFIYTFDDCGLGALVI